MHFFCCSFLRGWQRERRPCWEGGDCPGRRFNPELFILSEIYWMGLECCDYSSFRRSLWFRCLNKLLAVRLVRSRFVQRGEFNRWKFASYLSELVHQYSPTRTLQSSLLVIAFNYKSFFYFCGHRSFSYGAPFLLNSLPLHICQTISLQCVKSLVKTHLFDVASLQSAYL